jgi:hypothetical protein
MEFDIDNMSYSGGFILQLPLDTLPQRNAYRQTLIRFEQAIRALGLTLDTFKLSIDGNLRTLEQATPQYHQPSGRPGLRRTAPRLQHHPLPGRSPRNP